MKINDGPLNRYLIKNLQSLTEADPILLANYVAALLKNNKPKKELQKLCNEQLHDFLGDGTRGFVIKLFHALEDGSLFNSGEESDLVMQNDGGLGTVNVDINEPKGSPCQERIPSTAVRRLGDEVNDESSDDEDDDRNHKHRRRISRSRSFDRDRGGEEEDERMPYRKHGRSDNPQQPMRESEHHTFEHRRASGNADKDGISRRVTKEHGFGPHSRLNLEGQRGGAGGGLRAGSQFLSDPPGPGSRFLVPHLPTRGGIGRGRGPGNGTWLPHEQRLVPLFPDGPDFQSPAIAQGPPNVNFYANRGISGRGGAPQPPWSGFTPLSAISNGSLEHPHPLNPGIQGARKATLNSSVGNVMGMSIPRPRCLDFEERGYCLRGDLCPMEHGANRIVVEDFQSLSKFNLPATLPGGRNAPIGPSPVSAPSAISMLMPTIDIAGRGSRENRETTLSVGERTGILNGATGGMEPDSYDPDQPLFNKEPLDPVPGMRKLPSFQKERLKQDWERTVPEIQEVEDFDFVDFGKPSRGIKPNAGFKGTETTPSVWDRIGPVDRFGNKLLTVVSKVPPIRKPLKVDDLEEQVYGRGSLQDIRGDREVEAVDEAGLEGQDAVLGRNSGGIISATQVDFQSLLRPNDGIPHVSHRPGGHGSGGVVGERAQRTLYVRCIPTTSNKADLLLAHFQKFGEVLDIRIPLHSDRAFVQFARREDAEKALSSPDAVMGNRFIRLSWANRDNIFDPGELSTATMPLRPSVNSVNGQKVISQVVPASKDVARPVGTGTSESSVIEVTGKVVTGNGSASTASSNKKQEELEQMKEEIRKKQEALAKKREDFRQKLEKLAKQGIGPQTEVSEGSQPLKRQKLGELNDSSSSLAERQGSSGAVSSQGIPLSASINSVVEQQASPAVLLKSNAEEGSKIAATMITALQPASPLPFSRGIKSPHPRGSVTGPGLGYASSLAWGPARYKLDNRTMVFRIVPPIPAVISDVLMLKEHFAKFGELLSVELDNTDHDGDGKLTETSNVQVTFASRRAAERAFAQARSFQGQTLKFVWVNFTNGNFNSAMGSTVRYVDPSTGIAGVSPGNVSALEPLGAGRMLDENVLQRSRIETNQEIAAHDVRQSVSKLKEAAETCEETLEASSGQKTSHIPGDPTMNSGSEAIPAP
ncbi:hypothetical protein O6H91_13G075900 [Diphasiastrum complanatum]|uniref:Uncharacterized protein n=1 Tax=Diphasiastrum complanatum TaxID=34168 RepID=A0ACC2BWR5_DIPCM|nr:hypothetical protein O6H91_13G075900 [Diphasiastrum complanatum]